MKISIRYQILLMTAGLLIGSMAAYLVLASRMIERDKVGYLYDLQASMVATKSEQVRAELGSIEAMLAFFGSRADACEPGSGAARSLFDSDDDLLAVEIWNRDPGSGRWTRACHADDAARFVPLVLDPEDLAATHFQTADRDAVSHGQTVVSNRSEAPRAAILTLAVPSADGARVVVGDLHPSRLMRLFEDAHLYRTWLVDGDGTVLLHPDAQRVYARARAIDVPVVQSALAGKSPRGAREFDGPDGRVIGAFARVGIAQLVVISEVPRAAALAGMYDLVHRSVLFALAVVLFTLLVAIFFSRRLSRPLRQLEAAAQTVARGHLGTQVSIRTHNEIGRLGAAFNQMSADLKVREERLKTAQAQLVQADQLALIGTLSAGVAHEVNNPLSYMVTNLDFATKELREIGKVFPPTGPWREKFEELTSAISDARSGGEKVRAIMADMKLLSRRRDEPRAPVDVLNVLEGTLGMVAADMRRKARLVKDLQPVPPVLASELRLGQVFLNLLVNALQALPARPPEENEIRLVTRVAPHGRVEIEVGDNGTGVPPEIARRIFDPFFTTKPVGIGTGLGLSICQGIVTGFGGTITLDSVPGKGATFRISLPVAPPEALAETTPSKPFAVPAIRNDAAANAG